MTQDPATYIALCSFSIGVSVTMIVVLLAKLK